MKLNVPRHAPDTVHFFHFIPLWIYTNLGNYDWRAFYKSAWTWMDCRCFWKQHHRTREAKEDAVCTLRRQSKTDDGLDNVEIAFSCRTFEWRYTPGLLCNIGRRANITRWCQSKHTHSMSEWIISTHAVAMQILIQLTLIPLIFHLVSQWILFHLQLFIGVNWIE